MATKIGTTISGTFPDGPGQPNQSHLIYAANAGVWWLFTLTSASDSTGNPGTHVIKSYYSSGSDLSSATWTASTNSPNLDSDSAGLTNAFRNGRSLGCLYINNAAGTNKDILHCSASIFCNTVADSGNGVNGHIRAVLGATSITWGAWGYYETANFNYSDPTLISGNAIGVAANGYIQVGACVYHSELDAAVITSVDPDTGDTWTSGGSGTGNTTAGSALIKSLSNETGMAANYGVSLAGGSTNTLKINSIDSGTQVTASSGTGITAATGQVVRWNNLTPGSSRTNLVFDNTMVHECISYGFAQLASNHMLCVYDNGGAAPPQNTNLKSQKDNLTQAQGFWRSTNDGTGSVTVFSSPSTQDIQDWCVVGVDTTHIYVAQRSGNTTVRVNVYTDTGNGSWAATTNQPPTMTGKTIKAGGGVVGVTDGTNFWLFVIDSTDNAIKYCKFNVGAGTWDAAWTTLAAVDSTAKYLSCQPKFGALQAGLIYAVTNGANFDTYTIALSFNTFITPSQGSVSLTGSAPSVQVTVGSGLGSLPLSGVAPTVSQSLTIAVGLGGETLTGVAPLDILSVGVPAGSLAGTGQAPTKTNETTRSTGTGSLSVSGVSPSEKTQVGMSAGSLTIQGLSATETIVTLGAGGLTLSGQPPVVQEIIRVGAGSGTFSGQSPANQVSVPAPSGSVSIQGQAQAIQGTVITPSLGSIGMSGQAPSVSGGGIKWMTGGGVRRLFRQHHGTSSGSGDVTYALQVSARGSFKSPPTVLPDPVPVIPPIRGSARHLVGVQGRSRGQYIPQSITGQGEIHMQILVSVQGTSIRAGQREAEERFLENWLLSQN